MAVTKMGYLHLFEIQSCSQIYKSRVSQDTVFVGTRNSKTDGALVVNKAGALISLNIDESQLVAYIMAQGQEGKSLGSQLAQKYGLPGADGLFLEQFNRAIMAQDHAKAAQVAAASPGTLLRNQDTINKFKQMEPQPGQPKPIMIYFQTLLDKGALNKFETLELVCF